MGGFGLPNPPFALHAEEASARTAPRAAAPRMFPKIRIDLDFGFGAMAPSGPMVLRALGLH
jgi:hypothetical protein